MFCYQCQETAKNKGCTIKGVCGKDERTSNLQDLLIYTAKGVALCSKECGSVNKRANSFIIDSLFMTITNVNFDPERIIEQIREGLEIREIIKKEASTDLKLKNLHDCATWSANSIEEFERKATSVGVLTTEDEDIRSLRELVIYGLKGIAAYMHHAMVLGFDDDEIHSFIREALIATIDESLTVEDLVALVNKTGEYAVKTMALLDRANTETYGNPEITEVNIGVRNRPGILISGHDLKDLEQLLEQSADTGVDIYTHGEMLPANYYPAFKKYEHFVGNYGNSWWKQKEEFEAFNGPILMTTNCLVPPAESYKDRVYTTDVVGFPGVKHIEIGSDGKKDFSAIIEHAKKCDPPRKLEDGKIVGGFAHSQVIALADRIVEAVKSGAIKKFVVMAGCDGRQKKREYYTEFAKKLPTDTVILTAGCAKYRYNKLNLGDINGIPRVLDAGQCNDSYSLAVIALKLKEIFNLEDINELPIAYNIAWYEQKAVTVLLALLYLGVKNIKLGPTLPAFVSPGVLKVLVERFGISTISSVEEDMAELVGLE